MKCILIRNVKFSVAECNSFNIRKKNIGDLTSKKFIGGSNAKKQPSRCKVASFGVQSNCHHGAKLHPLECKVTPTMVQSNNYQNVIPIFFGFNLAYFPTTNTPPYTKKSALSKLHNYTVWVYIYAVLGIFTSSIC